MGDIRTVGRTTDSKNLISGRTTLRLGRRTHAHADVRESVTSECQLCEVVDLGRDRGSTESASQFFFAADTSAQTIPLLPSWSAITVSEGALLSNGFLSRADDGTRTHDLLHGNSLGTTRGSGSCRQTRASRPFAVAIREDALVRSPLEKLDPRELPKPRSTKKPRRLDDAELERLFAAAKTKTPGYHALFVLLAFTGLRIRESLALTWADIDFDQDLLRVERQLADDDRRQVDVKTANALRELPLYPRLRRVLLEHKLASP
jgi:integrase